jgi:hypothetical protein
LRTTLQCIVYGKTGIVYESIVSFKADLGR